MNKGLLCLGAAFLAWHGAAAQQQRDSAAIQVLDEVVVSDSRFELKREHSGKNIIRINTEELERNQGKSISEIINSRSGIEIAGSRGRQGEILGVFARGGRGRQVLIIVDGVRITDPSSFSQEYDLRLLSTANVASIEIIKGAASTLYGTNAATAVINIQTKNPSDRTIAGDFQSSFGTNQTSDHQNYNLSDFNNSARVSGTLKTLTYSAGFSGSYSDNISSIITPTNEDDRFSRTSTDIRLGYNPSERFSFSVYANQTRLRTDYDESFGMADAPYRFLSEQKRAGLTSRFSYGKGDMNLNMAFTEYDSENFSAFPNTFKGNNLVLDLFHKYAVDDTFYAILGLNYNKDRTTFEEDKEFTLTDPYVNMVYISPFGLNINAGGRMNIHSEYGNHFVYNFNPSYSVTTGKGYLKFLGSYASSYITPSLTQLFGVFGANPGLEPETNRTIEGGLEYRANHTFRANAVYFNRMEENYVFFDNGDFQYVNASDVIKAQGVEAELKWQPTGDFQVTANYTFTERKGDDAIRIPKHKLNMNAGYAFTDDTYASLTYAFTGTRTDTDFNSFSEVVLASYSLVGVYFSRDLIPDKCTLFLNVDNLLNESFTEVVGFSTRGRNFRVGLRLKL